MFSRSVLDRSPRWKIEGLWRVRERRTAHCHPHNSNCTSTHRLFNCNKVGDRSDEVGGEERDDGSAPSRSLLNLIKMVFFSKCMFLWVGRSAALLHKSDYFQKKPTSINGERDQLWERKKADGSHTSRAGACPSAFTNPSHSQ